MNDTAATPAQGEGVAPDNPFQRLRTRLLIPWVIAGTVVLMIVLGALTEVAGLALGRNLWGNPATREIVAMFAGYGALALWLLWAGRRAGIDFRRLIGRVPDGHDWLITAGLLGVTMAFSLGSWEVVAYTMSRLAPGLLTWLLEALATPPGGTFGHDLGWIVVGVLLAPVLEEVLFRGMLMSRWGVKWGIRTGIVVSAVCFGILHANAIGITVVGLVATILYLRTRTLIVPIAFHAANNAVATVAGFASGSDEPLDAAAVMHDTDGWYAFLLVIVSLPVLAWYLWRYWPERDATLPYMGDASASDPSPDEPG
ncbi:MAG: type II CAAX endopeptidase family protein [Gemmatimonadetes bacterium]|nr:type II CAAX endopeptidase family protein [Gemmatimonadota bacterium]